MTRFRTWAGGLGAATVAMFAACAGPSAAPPEGPPSTPSSSPTTTAEPAVAAESVGPAPESIRIDAIGVASTLVELGLDAEARMEVPADPDLAGWYAPGGRPGAGGPTVIAGHVDSETGPAVFARLRELRPGDLVQIGLAGGGHADYRVEELEAHPQDTFPTVAVFGAVPADELRLITCHGDYDDGYTENLVVHAVRV